MEKVRVTRDEAIQLKSFEHYFPRIIKEMDYGKVIKALRYGYEVEPEYGYGDWVIGVGNAGKVLDKPEQVQKVFDNQVSTASMVNVGVGCIRHATQEEIAAEKERRFWEKHGRDVWELREDDILDYLGDLLIVDSFDSEEVYFKSNKHDSSPNKYSETPSYVQKNFKVVALAENRLDVSKCLTT